MGDKAIKHLNGLNYQNQSQPGAHNVNFHKVDVTDEDSVNKKVDAVAALFGGVNILLCFAGITESKPAVEYPINSWKKIFDVNIHGSFLTARAVARSSLSPSSHQEAG